MQLVRKVIQLQLLESFLCLASESLDRMAVISEVVTSCHPSYFCPATRGHVNNELQDWMSGCIGEQMPTPRNFEIGVDEAEGEDGMSRLARADEALQCPRCLVSFALLRIRDPVRDEG